MTRSNALLAAVVTAFIATARVAAQDPTTITLTGIAADAKGPIANRVVMVMPIDALGGKPVTRHSFGHATLSREASRKSGSDPWTYFYAIAGSGPVLNPQAKTNAKGEFSVSVPLSLFQDPPNCATCSGYKAGELGLAIFVGSPGNLNVSHHEVELLKLDPKLPSHNIGKKIFKAAMPAK